MQRKELKIRMPPSETVMIVDAKYLVYRSQYGGGSANLEYSGKLTGLYYMFFNTVRQLCYKFNPVNVVLMWDWIGSKRKEEFSGYKERDTIKYMKPEQIKQLRQIKQEYPFIKDMCERLGFASYHLGGYEADDLIALFVNRFDNINKIIITRDEDMYQCIDRTTAIYSPDDKKKKNYRWFKLTYKIEPEQWGMIKAIAGCKSDTVPGIKGIGEKGALDIINNCASPSVINKYENGKKDLELWKRLTVLPHPDLKNHRIKYKITKIDVEQMIKEFQRMGFRSLLDKLSDFGPLLF